MDDKDKYRTLCRERRDELPIYMQDWWLDTVCGEKHWEAILLEGKKGQAIAALPLYLPIREVAIMPPFTQTLGPWIEPFPADMKYTTRLGRQQAILTELIRRLPSTSYLAHNCHHELTDWLPFYWAGFRQTTRYTYIIPADTTTEELYANMSANIRRNITKAEKRFQAQAESHISIDEFMRLQTITFDRQGEHLSTYQQQTLPRLIEACRQHGQGDLWACRDESGTILSAAFITWTNKQTYYIAGGSNTHGRESGAQSLLLWNLIQQSVQQGRAFDLEGSMQPGVERFFREFGAIQTPYFQISRGRLSLPLKIRMKLVRDYLKA